MIATGTDVKPLECVVFMRMVQVPELLRADEGPRRADDQRQPTSRSSPPTPPPRTVRARRRRRRHRDRAHRHHRRWNVSAASSLDKLLHQVAPRRVSDGPRLHPRRHAWPASTAASHNADREKLEALAGGRSSRSSTGSSRPIDPDRQLAAAQWLPVDPSPTEAEIAEARGELFDLAVQPLAANPELRDALVERAAQLRTDDRRDQHRPDHRAEYSQSMRGPRCRDRRVVPASSSTSTRTRSPPSRCSTAGPTPSGSPSATSRSWPRPSAARRTDGHPRTSGRPTRP